MVVVIGVNMKLVSTVVPLLCILPRLCVVPIDARCKITLQVSFNWRCNDNSDDCSVDDGNELEEGRFHPQRRWIGRQRMWDFDAQLLSRNNGIEGMGIR